MSKRRMSRTSIETLLRTIQWGDKMVLKDYPWPRTKFDTEGAELLYLMLTTVSKCVESLLDDMETAFLQRHEKDGSITPSIMELVEEQRGKRKKSKN